MSDHVLSPDEAQLLITDADKRAAALEAARHEMNILYQASNKLVRASTLSEQLEAISDYARSQGSTRGLLVYIEFEGEERLDEIVAEWIVGDTNPIGIGTQVRYPAHAFANAPTTTSQKPVFFKNVPEDTRVWSGVRDFNRLYNIIGCVVLPLFHKGRRIGNINFGWDHPHEFDERDERIYTVLQQQIASIVDSTRLFERLQKRAIELELANNELNLLYKTAELINSANTYQEVVEAVAQFDPEADVVTLMLWDTWDWKTARYLDVPVVIDRRHNGLLSAGSRLPKDAFPIAKQMIGHRVWLFEDAHTDPRIDPVTAENWETMGIRSFMGPALYIKKRWIGGITFHSSKPRKYSQREERLFTGVGDLVLAAIIRIRLQNETEDSRKYAETLANTNAELLRQSQQRAAELEAANAEIDLMYRIGEGINSANSYTELVHALSGIIEGATAVALFFWEGQDYQVASYVEQVAATGYLLPYVGRRVPKEILTYTASNPGDRLVIFEDVQNDSRLDDHTTSLYLARELQAAISIRLYVQNRWIGALVFNSNVPQVFSEKDKRLAAGVGDYVLGAVERIRLQDEKEHARLRAEMLGKVSSLLSQSTDDQAILNAVAELFHDLGVAWFGLAYSLNEPRSDGMFAEYVATIPQTEAAYPTGIFALDDYPCLKTAYDLPEAPIFVENVEADHRPEFRYLLTKSETEKWKAVIILPLKTGDDWQGLMSFYWYQPQKFTRQIRDIFSAIMPNVASVVTIRRAYLAEQEARHEAERYAEQAQKLASLEERTRLARDLHDSVSQVLYGIGLGARTARAVAEQDPSLLKEPLDYILALAEAGLTEMRALIFELRPESLEQQGLITTLEKQALSLSARHNIQMETKFCAEPDLPLDEKESLYRIAREALNNTIKHAQATSIRLTLHQTGGNIRLEIKDNGLGFDPNQTFTGHLGLKSMQERTAYLGGTLEIASSPGEGTMILVTVPLRSE